MSVVVNSTNQTYLRLILLGKIIQKGEKGQNIKT